MSLFGKRESIPAPKPSFSPKPSFPSKPAGSSRPSFGIMESLGLRSMPKSEQSQQAKPELKKLFGKEGYGSYSRLREFARKAPYESLPGTTKKLGRQERVAMIEDLRKRAERFQQQGTLSERTYRERVLPQMKKEKSALLRAGQINKARELEKKIKMYGKWTKGV